MRMGLRAVSGRKRAAAVLLFSFIAALITGCTFSAKNLKKEKNTDHLVMYLIGSKGSEHEKVMEKLNEMLAEDLNCSLSVEYISLGDYTTKYPLVLTSGEQIDLIMAANWLDYSDLSAQGLFLPIEEMVESCCPKSFEELDLGKLAEGQADGHLYMLPCNYTEPAAWGVIVRGDVMDELGYESIDNMDEYFQFCIDVAAKTDYLDSTSQTLHLQEEVILYSLGYCPVDGSSGAPYWFQVKRGDETGEYKVYNKAEIPELQDYFRKAGRLFEQGAWSESALSNTDTERMREGLSASFLHLPNRWISIASGLPDTDVRFYNMADPVYIPSEHAYIGMSVPVTSKNPKKALQILELLHQDRRYYDLLTYGIEGEHYTVDAETDSIHLINQEGYPYDNGTWGFRDIKFMKTIYGLPAGYDMVQSEVEDALYDNVFRTFLLDTSSIRTEYDAVQQVMNREYTLMNMGYVDYESGMEKVQKALREAGDEKCKREIQRQVDLFITKNRQPAGQ